MPAVEHQRNVDVDDVAITHRLVVGDAVTDDVIDGSADALPISAVHQRGRVGAIVEREFEHEIVERLGRDAGLHHRHEKIQRFSGEPPSTSHTLEGLGPVELDLAGLATSALRSFDERHQVIRIAPSKPYQMGQTGAPRKVHECRDTFAQCSFNHYHRGRDWLSGPLQGTRPRIMSEPDDLMTALDPTSFGAYRPTGWAETLISYTRSMPRNWAGRRVAYALRQIAIWMLRGQPLDVDALGAKMRLTAKHPDGNLAQGVGHAASSPVAGMVRV